MFLKFLKTSKVCPFTLLFYTLLLTIGVQPILGHFGLDILEYLLALNLVAVILTSSKSHNFTVILCLAIAFVIARAAGGIFTFRALFHIGDLLWMGCCTAALVAAGRQILRPGVVDSRRIHAALDLYLLAGVMFAVCYRLLDHTFPQSFNVSSAGPISLNQAIYFSFVTLATLGYGDIVPVTDAARGIAILEAVIGQIYLAVLVARLVSLYSQQYDKR